MEFLIFCLICLIIILIIIVITISYRINNIEEIANNYIKSNNKILDTFLKHNEKQDEDIDLLLKLIK